MRDKTFYSLPELNLAYKEFLILLNKSPMKDHGDVSRNDRFELWISGISRQAKLG